MAHKPQVNPLYCPAIPLQFLGQFLCPLSEMTISNLPLPHSQLITLLLFSLKKRKKKNQEQSAKNSHIFPPLNLLMYLHLDLKTDFLLTTIIIAYIGLYLQQWSGSFTFINELGIIVILYFTDGEMRHGSFCEVPCLSKVTKEGIWLPSSLSTTSLY